MEREKDSIICIDCPVEPGRFCVPYKGGETRLVYRPSSMPSGPKYREAYERPESISVCPNHQKVIKGSDIIGDVTS